MNVENFLILDAYSAREALQKLNEISNSSTTQLSLFIINNSSQVLGSLTDGDIRRGLINGLSVDDNVKKFMYANFKFLNNSNYNKKTINDFKILNIRYVPFIDLDNRIIKIIDLEEIISQLPIDAVIMAGGKGERLLPLTETIPKPLLKIGEKPVIEYNIDNLKRVGIVNFHVSINYLGDKIESYLGNGRNKQISINYLKESNPQGTLGSICLVKEWHNNTVLVMNSDLLTNIDFVDFYNFFIENDADMAIASVPYVVNVPYAVFETTDHVKIRSIKEKPRYTYYSNAGIYLIKKEIIEKHIPYDKKFDATDLIQNLVELNKNVISYPITSYWLDIGRMEDYQKAQEDIKHIKFN